MAEYGLVCPFLDEAPSYAHGVEFGMLWNRLRGDEDEIDDIISTANQEQVTLAANRLGWHISGMEQLDEFWVKIRLTR